MSESASPAASSTLDARILHLILKGQLRESSTIADQGRAVLLADHPRFSGVLLLSRLVRSARLLTNVGWWHAQTPEWVATLAQKPMSHLLFEQWRARATGFLTVAQDERIKVLSLASGVCTSVGSNIAREQIDQTTIAMGLLSAPQCEAAWAEISPEKPFEWATLQLGLLGVSALVDAHRETARGRLLDLFSWSEGEIHFFPDDRASQLEATVHLPLLVVLRRGAWDKDTTRPEVLRAATQVLFEHTEALKVQHPLGTLTFELSEIEKRIYALTEQGRPPAELAALLDGLDDAARLEGLRFVYLFTQLGVLGVDAPEFMQPVLMPLDDAGAVHSEALVLEPLAAPMLALPDVPEIPATPGLPLAQEPARRMTGPKELKEYRLQIELEQEGRRLLNSGQYDDAIVKFKQLIDRQERPVAGLAYLSVATLLARGSGARDAAFELAQKALALDAEDALAHAAMARALAGKGKKFEVEERRALSLSQHNDAWFLEVRALLQIGQASRRARERAAATAGAVALILAVLLLGGLFVAANLLGLGKDEYFYRPDDKFFYARRVGLLLVGLIGLKLVTQARWTQLLSELRFGASAGGVAFALLWGGAVGFFSPPQRVTGGLVAVIGLTLLHVIAEEVFFRAFITRALLDRVAEWQQALFFSALIFAAYHLTYYSFWAETGLGPKFYWCAMIGLFAGFPYAALYHKGGGLGAAVLCHATVNLTMMVLSTLKT